MPRIATYNVEWFNALFDDEGRLLDDGWSARQNVRRHAQIEAPASSSPRSTPMR